MYSFSLTKFLLYTCYRCAEIAATVTSVEAKAISKPEQAAKTEMGGGLNVIVISGLVVLCASLGMIVILLVVRVVSQRKRPRIRKRIVVNKPISPFPCIPDQPSREQCEITIENCCNMNICETVSYHILVRFLFVSR